MPVCHGMYLTFRQPDVGEHANLYDISRDPLESKYEDDENNLPDL